MSPTVPSVEWDDNAFSVGLFCGHTEDSISKLLVLRGAPAGWGGGEGPEPEWPLVSCESSQDRRAVP